MLFEIDYCFVKMVVISKVVNKELIVSEVLFDLIFFNEVFIIVFKL